MFNIRSSELVLSLFLALVTLAMPPVSAAEQTYPSQNIRFIVPYGVGGGPDSLTRMIAQSLSKEWGHAVITENKPGASGVIGFDFASRAKPDGHTVFFADSAILAINPQLRPKMTDGKDVFQLFAPVTLATEAPMVLVASPKFKATTLSELISHVKANPGKYSYATPGSGTVQHIVMEQLMREAGLKMVHVPFGSLPAAAPSLLNGDIAMMFATTTPVLGLLRSGDLHAIAAGGARRLAALPNVPTFAEAGMPKFNATINFGYLVPFGTPSKIIEKLQEGIAVALQSPEASTWLSAQGMESVNSSPADYLAISRNEFDEYHSVIKAADIKVD